MLTIMDNAYEKARKRRIETPEWKIQLAKELLKPKRRRFERRRVFAGSVNSIWTADLLDIQNMLDKTKDINLSWLF